MAVIANTNSSASLVGMFRLHAGSIGGVGQTVFAGRLVEGSKTRLGFAPATAKVTANVNAWRAAEKTTVVLSLIITDGAIA